MAPNSKIYVPCYDDVKVIEYNNGTFTHSVLISVSTIYLYCLITDDQSMLVLGGKTFINVFKKNGTGYGLDQTLAEEVFADGLAMSADEKEIFFCKSSLSIYRYNGTMFVLAQRIALGFMCFTINIINNLIEVHGFSSELRFYEFNGSQYVLKCTVFTNETVIKEISVLENGEKIMLGGHSQNISSYTYSNGSFELAGQLHVGEDVMEVFVHQGELYFLYTTSMTIEVLFRCPDECSTCHFPNNCTACIQGYRLQGVKCVENPKHPTHCVQNKFAAKGICEEYCDRRCKTCNMTRGDCVECA